MLISLLSSRLQEETLLIIMTCSIKCWAGRLPGGLRCARVSVCVCSRMHALPCLLKITSQVAMLKIPHIPEKYSLLPYIHQGVKTKITFPLPCLPNQGKIVLLNWTQSSAGVKWRCRCLGCCAELSHCLSVSTPLLMLCLYHISAFLNKL